MPEKFRINPVCRRLYSLTCLSSLNAKLARLIIIFGHWHHDFFVSTQSISERGAMVTKVAYFLIRLPRNDTKFTNNMNFRILLESMLFESDFSFIFVHHSAS